MRKELGPKTLTFPMPVHIIGTYDENGIPDAMNAAWGGISNDNEIFLCLSHTHKTVENLKKTGAFTVSVGTKEQLAACDYVGMVSGHKEPDKVAKAGFNAVKSSHVNAPIFQELPMTLECKVKSYDDENDRLIGEIVNISVAESILTNGMVDSAKLHPIAFDSSSHTYVACWIPVGKAFVHREPVVK